MGTIILHVIQQGDCNAPMTMMRVMKHLLIDLIKEKLGKIYLDDIIIASNSRDEVINTCRKLLDILGSEKFWLNKDKCTIFPEKMRILGHIKTKDSLKANPQKIIKLNNIPTPTCTKDVQKLMGEAVYMSKFVMNFAKLTAALSAL